MAEEHLATSIRELTLKKLAVSSIGFEENDQIVHASDDSLCDDEPPEETSGAELIREQKRRHDKFYTMGYRDGISAGIEASAQEGFNMGFKPHKMVINEGNVRGITSAFASLPDDSKKKLLKKFEDKEKFHSLYKSVQVISTDNALKLYYAHLLQNDNQFKEHLKGNPQGSSTTSAREDSNSNKLDFLLEALTSLVHESSRIKLSIVDESGFTQVHG